MLNAETLDCVLGFVRGADMDLARLAANVIWAIAPATAARAALEALSGVDALHGLLARTLDVRTLHYLFRVTVRPVLSLDRHGCSHLQAVLTRCNDLVRHD